MSEDEAPRLVNRSGDHCGYALVDRYGELYPCDEPSVAALVNGSEQWGGPWESPYCKRHATKALRGSLRDLTPCPDA